MSLDPDRTLDEFCVLYVFGNFNITYSISHVCSSVTGKLLRIYLDREMTWHIYVDYDSKLFSGIYVLL